MLHPIERAIPDVRVFLGLEPEELAAKLIFLIRSDYGAFGGSQGMFSPAIVLGRIKPSSHSVGLYGGERSEEAAQHVREAIAWLQAQALLVPHENGWFVFSRRALGFENERQFADYRISRLLPREALHSSLGEAV